MQSEDVPSSAAESLGEVEILLIAGKAVEEDGSGMELRSGG